ncbi:Cytochrome C [Sphingomonas antarctica]|uniref:c-type cytochrome n=1 Tax=Sphingomonas antarctica TaxID=2040274 RepID=UPI0039E7795B
MDDRFNTISMMVLGAGIVALGATIVSSEYFRGEKPEHPGYVVEGVVEESADAGAVADPPIAMRMQTAEEAKGAETFKKCASCHTITQGGANGIGPNLYATVGEAAGEGKGGYAFSDALKGKGVKWGFAELDQWLTKPSAYVPGTKMSFAGLSNAMDRANVIAYLNSQGSNLPLPAAPAAGASGAPEAPAGQGAKTDTPPSGPQPGGTPGNSSAPATKPGA